MKKMNRDFPYYPVFLNISGKRCVVIGGGQVALRKVRALIEHGASVEVISPDLCPELIELAKKGQIHTSCRCYQPGDLQQALIAIAATDNSDVNRQVTDEARNRAVLVNVVDDPDNSDFIVPSSIHRGDITIAVSTAGKSPALSRKIRARLENEFGEDYISLANMVSEARTELRRQGIKVRGDDWQEALDLDLMIDLLKKGEVEKARAVLLDNLNIRPK